MLAAWATQWPDDGVEVFTVADSLEPVRCAKGMRVVPDATWETAGKMDVLVYPGGRERGRSSATRPSAPGCRGLPATGR